MAGAVALVAGAWSSRHPGQRGRTRANLDEVARLDLDAPAPRIRGCGHSGRLRRPRAKPQGTRMVGIAPPAGPAPPAEVRELGAAGRAVARWSEAREEGQRRGRGQRLEGVSAHAAPHWRKPSKTGETRPCAHTRAAPVSEPPSSDGLPRPPSVDAPLLELHERHSTDVFATSNGAPPAASGTTWSTVRSPARWAGRL